MNDIADRVARGAAWLDEHYPTWWQGIDLAILDVGNCTRCVLGQVYTGVIPTAERGQVLAQAIANSCFGDAEYITEYRQQVGSGQLGGYNVLVDAHEMIGEGMAYGFASTFRYPYDLDEENAEYQALLDEWTRFVVSRRMAVGVAA